MANLSSGLSRPLKAIGVAENRCVVCVWTYSSHNLCIFLSFAGACCVSAPTCVCVCMREFVCAVGVYVAVI